MVWGRQPALRRGAESVADLLTIDDIDRFIASGVRRPAVRMVRAGEILAPSTYSVATRLGGENVAEVVDGRMVADQIVDGATLVLQSLHRQWGPLVRFADELMSEIGHPIQINAYLTPSNAAGLRPHRDAHDVFVVQTDGRKHWTVEGLGDVQLERGDVLYIPAGCDHSAATTDELSLHLTIGILRITYRSVLERVLEEGPSVLDEPLPVAFHEQGSDADDRQFEIGVARMMTRVIDHLRTTRVGDVVDRERRRRLVPYSRGGHLQSVLRAEHLTPDSVIRWTTVLPRMQPASDDDGRVRVLLSDRTLRMPETVIPAISLISNSHGGIRVSDLPDLDPTSQVVVARRLVLEGACVIQST